MLRAGVPTQTNDTSVARIASRTESVTVTLPLRMMLRVSSWMPVSTIGACPRRSISSFDSSMSTPVISCPSRARQASDTAPT